jgi:class 3 adenylate cyclase
MITFPLTTVLCDVPGLSAGAASGPGDDPGRVPAVVEEYHAVVERIVAGHGGLVERFVGDDVAAVFGLLVTREDDPERAVRAALAIVAGLGQLALPDGSPLLARVGVETLETPVRPAGAVDPWHEVPAGAEIGAAARVLAAAPLGRVAVGALTRKLTAGAFDYAAAPVSSIRRDSDRAAAWLVRTPDAPPHARWSSARPAVVPADDTMPANLTQTG